MPENPEDPLSDDDVVDEFADQHGLDTETWTEDGEKYRCPECGAVHDERAGSCRVCGWERV